MSTETYNLKLEYKKSEAKVLKEAQKLADKLSIGAIIALAGLCLLVTVWRIT